MSSARQKPWKKVKTPSGIKYKYDFQDLNWGIKRVKKTFNSAEEASIFHDNLKKNAMSITRGDKPERSFGEALIEHLTQIEADGKLGIGSDESDLLALRWPFYYNKRWYRLEELPMNDQEGGIVWGIAKYKQDLKKVIRRSYIKKGLYQLRRENNELIWYFQPNPADDLLPKNRVKVICPTTLVRLSKAKGRGPFASDTFRRRTSLVKTILTNAWNEWRWLDQDLSKLIKLDKPSKGVISFLIQEQYDELLKVADEYFGYLIRAAKNIGWRQQNLIGLTWDRVHFPKYKTNIQGETIKKPGYLRIDKFDNTSEDFNPRDRKQRRTRTKNKDDLDTVMTEELEILLREMESKKHPDSNVVFHTGDGSYWGDFRKRWITAKKRAGIAPQFRWHDLRHTWATDRINEGVPRHIIMEEQGWKDPGMVDRYAHIQRDARYEALKNAKKKAG
ncbi:tyrosine-type recombinase/integrase [Endozoicomonas sp. ONNA1]|uniref:tyrosine-type recombinase/integrase n=1 Tax=Endozoicomonas sp. ONNA1 TaxID=2828740 RepID=UPI0021477643|nr:tyrosine-type recombinase/integrase [Endozoicomonas sp. ONNA1]